MSVPAGLDGSPNYALQLFALVRQSARPLVQAPSDPRYAEARRRTARHALALTAILGALVVVLMFTVDASEIALMPPRGTPGLWPARVLTSFGKDGYVLGALAAALVAVVVITPLAHGASRVRLLQIGVRLQYLFCAVLLPIVAAAGIKWAVGRGRPFVGGAANPFNFAPFTGTEAYFSFPSAHAVTAFALAFAVGALWPRIRPLMFLYAVAIAGSRLVLLAHHPSDVVAGALVGVVGAMIVRYWFAARRIGFAIGDNGEIRPL